MADQDITIRISAQDATGGALGSVRKELGGLDDNLKKGTGSATTFGAAFGQVKKLAAGFVVADALSQLPGLFTAGVNEAVRLDAGMQKVQTVFGESSQTVADWAEQFAHSMGLSVDNAQILAAGMGDLLVPLGATRAEAAQMSTDVIGLAGALSQWTGGTRSAEQVSLSLTKALLGEREELKTLGISITEADVNARLLANGQDHLTGSARQLAAAQATMALIYEKSTDAQAAFAAGGDSAVRAQAELRAKMQELQQVMAEGVLPIFESFAPIVITAMEAATTPIQLFAKGVELYLTPALVGLNLVVDGINAVGNAANEVGAFLGFGGGDGGGLSELELRLHKVAAAEDAVAFSALSLGTAVESADTTVGRAASTYDVYTNAASFAAEAALASELAMYQNEAAALANAAAIDTLTASAQANASAYGDNELASLNFTLALQKGELATLEAKGATDEQTASIRADIAATEAQIGVWTSGTDILNAFTESLRLNYDRQIMSEQEALALADATAGLAAQTGDATGAVALANDALFFFGGRADDVTGRLNALAAQSGATKVEIDGVGNAVLTMPDGKTITISAHDLASGVISDIGWRLDQIPRLVTIVIDAIGDTYPHFARGTNNAPKGMAWVGEQGPELRTFKGGEQVFNASQSRAMASGHGGGGGGGDETIQLVVDGRVLAEVVNRHNARDMRAAGLFRGG